MKQFPPFFSSTKQLSMSACHSSSEDNKAQVVAFEIGRRECSTPRKINEIKAEEKNKLVSPALSPSTRDQFCTAADRDSILNLFANARIA